MLITINASIFCVCDRGATNPKYRESSKIDKSTFQTQTLIGLKLWLSSLSIVADLFFLFTLFVRNVIPCTELEPAEYKQSMYRIKASLVTVYLYEALMIEVRPSTSLIQECVLIYCLQICFAVWSLICSISAFWKYLCFENLLRNVLDVNFRPMSRSNIDSKIFIVNDPPQNEY